STNPLINEVIGRYLGHKGKQLRPMMVILTARLLNATATQRLIASAASIEMLHNASLIHDDVIDQSSTRHGVPTINTIWDNHIAVLVGDYFVSAALQLVISTGDLRAIGTIASLGRLLSTGEMDQIHNATNHSLSEASYFEIITHKTASLFVACVEMGAYASDADERTLDIMRRFARLFGQCFQIKDDIFDYFHSDSLGKPTGNDLREGKVTLPLLYALSLTDHPEHDKINGLLTRGSLSDEEIAGIIDFTIRVGGIEYAEATLRRLRDQAAGILAELGPDADTTWLLTLLDYIISRDK
ncbi:MAG: polyprenyl synthetase family protein, partial [Duncaniella sp.]|nr:polyprenyl synthetase family protein [Duncaniella sp.]